MKGIINIIKPTGQLLRFLSNTGIINYNIKLNRFLKRVISIKVCNIAIYDILNLFVIIKNIILESGPFIRMLFTYLISKYYYKLTEIDFVIKAYTDRKTFRFFAQLTRIKFLFVNEKCIDKLYISMLYYYMIMFIAFIYYYPTTWFLLRVLTDPQNWMLYFFAHMGLSNAM